MSKPHQTLTSLQDLGSALKKDDPAPAATVQVEQAAPAPVTVAEPTAQVVPLSPPAPIPAEMSATVSAVGHAQAVAAAIASDERKKPTTLVPEELAPTPDQLKSMAEKAKSTIANAPKLTPASEIRDSFRPAASIIEKYAEQLGHEVDKQVERRTRHREDILQVLSDHDKLYEMFVQLAAKLKVKIPSVSDPSGWELVVADVSRPYTIAQVAHMAIYCMTYFDRMFGELKTAEDLIDKLEGDLDTLVTATETINERHEKELDAAVKEERKRYDELEGKVKAEKANSTKYQPLGDDKPWMLIHRKKPHYFLGTTEIEAEKPKFKSYLKVRGYSNPEALRFSTKEEAEACIERLRRNDDKVRDTLKLKYYEPSYVTLTMVPVVKKESSDD